MSARILALLTAAVGFEPRSSGVPFFFLRADGTEAPRAFCADEGEAMRMVANLNAYEAPGFPDGRFVYEGDE